MMAIVPNTFQTFNIYVDRAMELLTDSELRVLIFATRHILGWQSNINSRTAEISVSMFTDGYTDKHGNYYGGCGLSRGTVIQTTEALVQFGFLDRVGKPTPKGQRWQLSDRDIDWQALEARRDEQQANNKKRLKKTRAGLQKSEGGLSDSTSAVAQTDSGLTDSTVTGLTDRHNQNQSHVQNHIAPNGAARPNDPIYDAVKETIFGIDDPAVVAGGRIGKISNWLKGKYQGTKGKEVGLISAPAKVEHITSFSRWYARQYPDVSLPRDFEKFVEHWREWASSAKPAKTTGTDLSALGDSSTWGPDEWAKYNQLMREGQS